MPRKTTTAGDGKYKYPLPQEIVTLERHYNPPTKVTLDLPGQKVRLCFTRRGNVTVATIKNVSTKFAGAWFRSIPLNLERAAYCNPEDEPSVFVGDRLAAKRVLETLPKAYEDFNQYDVRRLYKLFRVKQRQLCGWRGMGAPRAIRKLPKLVVNGAEVAVSATADVEEPTHE